MMFGAVVAQSQLFEVVLKPQELGPIPVYFIIILIDLSLLMINLNIMGL